MGDVGVVVNAPGWCMCDEYVEVASVACFVSQQAGDHTQQVEGDLLFGILVRTFVVEGTALDSGYQQR